MSGRVKEWVQGSPILHSPGQSPLLGAINNRTIRTPAAYGVKTSPRGWSATISLTCPATKRAVGRGVCVPVQLEGYTGLTALVFQEVYPTLIHRATACQVHNDQIQRGPKLIPQPAVAFIAGALALTSRVQVAKKIICRPPDLHVPLGCRALEQCRQAGIGFPLTGAESAQPHVGQWLAWPSMSKPGKHRPRMLCKNLKRALVLKPSHYVPGPGNEIAVYARHTGSKEVPGDEYLVWLCRRPVQRLPYSGAVFDQCPNLTVCHFLPLPPCVILSYIYNVFQRGFLPKIPHEIYRVRNITL